MLARCVFNLLVMALLFTAACEKHRVPQIPMSISDEEYSVYSAWIRLQFAQQPPLLLLASRTFIFEGCGDKVSESEGFASLFLLDQFKKLGEA